MSTTLGAPPRYFCYSVNHELRDRNSLRTWDTVTEQPESLKQYEDYIAYFDSLFAEQIVELDSGDEVKEFLDYHLDYFKNSVGGDQADFLYHLNTKVIPKIKNFKTDQTRQAMLVWLFLKRT